VSDHNLQKTPYLLSWWEVVVSPPLPDLINPSVMKTALVRRATGPNRNVNSNPNPDHNPN